MLGGIVMWKDKMMGEARKQAKEVTKNPYIYPTRGDILAHKKGGFYIVICLSKHTETRQPLVSYQCLETKEYHTRPLEMFTEDRFTIAFNVMTLKEFLK
jgi:hypothetical protein